MKIYLKEIGELKIIHSKRAKYTRVSFDNSGKIILTIPFRSKTENALKFVVSKKKWIIKNQELIKRKKALKLNISYKALQKFWKTIENKTFVLSEKYKLPYDQLIFKTYKSKWGSCSSDNVICLNNLIYYLPSHLQEYIILHELVHTKIKNHSVKFWDELEKICMNAKLKRKELQDQFLIK